MSDRCVAADAITERCRPAGRFLTRAGKTTGVTTNVPVGAGYLTDRSICDILIPGQGG